MLYHTVGEERAWRNAKSYEETLEEGCNRESELSQDWWLPVIFRLKHSVVYAF